MEERHTGIDELENSVICADGDTAKVVVLQPGMEELPWSNSVDVSVDADEHDLMRIRKQRWRVRVRMREVDSREWIQRETEEVEERPASKQGFAHPGR